MLITKNVEIKASQRNIEYYKSLGYKCKYGDIIEVKVQDIQRGSVVKVECECDMCHSLFAVTYKLFANQYTLSSKTYCDKCKKTITESEKCKKIGKYLAHDGVKICRRCNRELPANTDYYNNKCDTKDNLTGFCKECLGRKFTNHLTHIPKSGYKFCKKCDRELPIDIKYFSPDKMCKDGLRSVCRECNGDAFKIHDENWCSPWSDADIELLKEIYSKYSGKQLQEYFFPNRTIRGIESMANKIGCRGKEGKRIVKTHNDFISEFNNVKATDKHLEYITILGKYSGCNTKIQAWCDYCKKSWDAIPSNLLKGSGCPNCKGRFISQYRKQNNIWSGENNPRHINPMCGKDNPNWKDGATSLYRELRSETKDWFIDTNKIFDWKCALTGEKFDNVHHLVEFKDILTEVLEIYELDRRKSIGDYSDEEQLLIKDGIRQLHKKYGYGVSLCEPIHTLFHKLYSYNNCNKYDFLEFTNRFANGEFKGF